MPETRVNPKTGQTEAVLSLPTVGSCFVLFGVEYRVRYVEPQTDWTWSVEARTVWPIAGSFETVTFIVPADSLTN